MQISVKEKNGVDICYIKGEINIDTSSQLKKVFGEFIVKKSRKILLNFKDVEYIDSLGIATLVGLMKSLREIQGTMFLCNLSAKLGPVFGITKMDRVLRIFETEEEALREFYGY